jgi:cob(I)alamin adenosyltransferase
MVRAKPQNLELVLTGRGATEALIKKTDLVNEVEEVKHPYE